MLYFTRILTGGLKEGAFCVNKYCQFLALSLSILFLLLPGLIEIGHYAFHLNSAYQVKMIIWEFPCGEGRGWGSSVVTAVAWVTDVAWVHSLAQELPHAIGEAKKIHSWSNKKELKEYYIRAIHFMDHLVICMTVTWLLRVMKLW